MSHRMRGWVLIVFATVLAGCDQAAKLLEIPYIYRHKDPLADIALHQTFAVLPILNQTGKNEIANEDYAVQTGFVGQLQQVKGLHVLPMQRVRAYLANKGQVSVQTPRQAIELARELNVDAVLVVAITRFDPYDPPTVGMTVALFRKPLGPASDGVDPMAFGRMPTLLTHERVQAKLVNQQVFQFDARSDAVIERVKAFAERRRGSTESPWGYRRYIVSAREYLTFCSYEAIRTLLVSEAEMLAAARKRHSRRRPATPPAAPPR